MEWYTKVLNNIDLGADITEFSSLFHLLAVLPGANYSIFNLLIFYLYNWNNVSSFLLMKKDNKYNSNLNIKSIQKAIQKQL